MRISWKTVGGMIGVAALVAACAAGVVASRGTVGANKDGEVNSPLQEGQRPPLRTISEPSKRFPPELSVGELHVTIKEWDVPTKGAHPHDPAVGMDGALWFTEQMQNKIGRLDPSAGAFKEFPLKVDNSGPHGLVSTVSW